MTKVQCVACGHAVRMGRYGVELGDKCARCDRGRYAHVPAPRKWGMKALGSLLGQFANTFKEFHYLVGGLSTGVVLGWVLHSRYHDRHAGEHEHGESAGDDRDGRQYTLTLSVPEDVDTTRL